MQILAQKVLDGAQDSEFSTNCQVTLLLLLWGPVSFCGPVNGTWEQTWMGVSRVKGWAVAEAGGLPSGCVRPCLGQQRRGTASRRRQVQGQAQATLLRKLRCALLCRAPGQAPGGCGEHTGQSGFLDLLGAGLYREPMSGDGGSSSQMATARGPGLLQTWVPAEVGPEKGAAAFWMAGWVGDGGGMVFPSLGEQVADQGLVGSCKASPCGQ